MNVLEKTLLENLPTEYKYIARDEQDRLYLYKEKPTKQRFCWFTYDKYSEFPYEHFFDYVKWQDSEPQNISNILKTKFGNERVL